MGTTTGYEGLAMRIVQLLKEYSRPLPIEFLAKQIGQVVEADIEREVAKLCNIGIVVLRDRLVSLKNKS